MDIKGITCMHAQSLSRVRLCVTPQTVASQAPLSMGILQARMLEWVAMSSFNQGYYAEWKMPNKKDDNFIHMKFWKMKTNQNANNCLPKG